MLFSALDDLEAEITYLLLRDFCSGSVFEMSPNAGWSTTWILSALRDNGETGHLQSHDIHARRRCFVPEHPLKNKWELVLGDAKEAVNDVSGFDFFFIDSDHSREFTEWYVDHILSKVKPRGMVCVPDIYHHPAPSEEGEVVLKWLRENA